MMNEYRMQVEAGGFLHSDLPSPPLSALSSAASPLPQPRSTALKAGSSKESTLRNYVESKLLEISGRFERRFQADEPSSYKSFAELAKDLNGVVDIIWISGTPALQIPFFLTIALSISNYLASFAFDPQATLQLLQKLDCAFSSLLHGQDVITGALLPGFETGRRFTVTEKVRLRGLVERTRVQLVDVSKSNDFEKEPGAVFSDELTSDDSGDEDPSGDLFDVDLDVARVYERVLADLSDLETSFES